MGIHNWRENNHPGPMPCPLQTDWQMFWNDMVHREAWTLPRAGVRPEQMQVDGLT